MHEKTNALDNKMKYNKQRCWRLVPTQYAAIHPAAECLTVN